MKHTNCATSQPLSLHPVLVLPTFQVLGTQLLITIIFGNQEAAQSATSCQTVEEHPLNTSDHLPICCSFDISHLRTITPPAFPESPLDWRTAYKDCTTLLYASQVDDFIQPFLSKEYCDMVSLESDLTIISQKLISIANLCIPKKKERTVHHQRDKIHDPVLSEVCWKSCSAFRVWKNSGRPLSGPIYDDCIRCKRAVKFHLNTMSCRAREERKRIQRRDEMFESNHSRHFQSNYKKKVSCTKLLSDGKVISDPDELVAVWESYFKSLATSKCSSNPQLMSSLQKLNVLEAETYRTCDPILGDSITVEEVEGAIRHLKPMRSGGADSLTPEHLKHCGSIFKNGYVSSSTIYFNFNKSPVSSNTRLSSLYTRERVKIPLSVKSFRGIALSSVIFKNI